ncbi:hypothetical protein H1235_08375 [Pseudoxanthomonas sp. NC8]|nr:hypothetical protein H1235_08375 [Pseudoxanthomonas sp. NC8]
MYHTNELNAMRACEESLSRLQQLPESRAAYCLVLEGMFSEPGIDLLVVGTIAEIDNRIPQIGLVFDEQFQFVDVFTNLAIDLSPALTKTLLGAAGTAAALSLLVNPVLGLFALVGGALLYNSIDDMDVEETIRAGIRRMGPPIAAYVKRALERITDLGANGLHARIAPGAAADGSDNLHIQYFNPADASPPRPRPPGIFGTFGGAVETMVLAQGDNTGPAGNVARRSRLTANAVTHGPLDLPLSTGREPEGEAPGPLPPDSSCLRRKRWGAWMTTTASSC